MSPAAPDQTETDSSMMLAAAKPATPTRLSKAWSARFRRFCALPGEFGGLEADAVERLDKVDAGDAGRAMHGGDAPGGQVGACRDDAGNGCERQLDLAHAAAAMHAFDGQGRGYATRGLAGVAMFTAAEGQLSQGLSHRRLRMR